MKIIRAPKGELTTNQNLKVTTFDTSDNEGQTIIGTNYISGKSGIDASTEAIYTVTYEHHEIHEGSHFTISRYFDLPINNYLDVRIVTPNTTKWSHMTFTISCESETVYTLYEGVTVIAAGTSRPARNNNRNSLNTADTVVSSISTGNLAAANAATSIAAATDLFSSIIGSGKDAGANSRQNELILKQNTAYSIRLLANTAGYVNYDLEWYEHTNKN